MLLTQETAIWLNENAANLVGHMCYAAYKLWNVCNYERNHYKELSLKKYPDWYYQKSNHRNNLWYKSLPSQSAQEICKLLDKAWKSFFALKRSGGIENPKPPRYKNDLMPITYMQNAVKHEPGSDYVRLSLPKKLKEHMFLRYGISDTYLFLKNPVFSDTDQIKQIKLYPPEADGKTRMLVIYEIEDVMLQPENERYLSVDLGLHNLMTCYDNSGKTFILGRKYLSICQYYDKEIARVQSQWAGIQVARGIRYPKSSSHILRLYRKQNNCVKDYIHKMTRYVVDYCFSNEIHTVVIGDIKGIRNGNDLGTRINRQLHSLPYDKIYMQLEYKLKRRGIRLVKQEESYTSQCAPLSEEVSAVCACRSNRKKRGLYCVDSQIYNADAVGAYNILRKYHAVSGNVKNMPVSGLDQVKVVQVAV